MKVMLVDDDPSTLRVTQVMLRSMGHATVEFEDPVRALASLAEQPVDLVISDVKMPGLDGFAVAERVADILGASPPRVLLMTGIGDIDVQLDAAPPAVVIGVLAKPFDRNELSRVVGLIDATRTRCPGLLAPLCLYAPEDASAPAPAVNGLCNTPRYFVNVF